MFTRLFFIITLALDITTTVALAQSGSVQTVTVTLSPSGNNGYVSEITLKYRFMYCDEIEVAVARQNIRQTAYIYEGKRYSSSEVGGFSSDIVYDITITADVYLVTNGQNKFLQSVRVPFINNFDIGSCITSSSAGITFKDKQAIPRLILKNVKIITRAPTDLGIHNKINAKVREAEEKKRKAEQEKKLAEEKKKKAEEEKRLAEEKRKKEEEQERIAKEKKKKAEEEKLAAEKKAEEAKKKLEEAKTEAEKKAAEEEKKKANEQKRLAEEAAKKAEEEERIAEEKRQDEEKRKKSDSEEDDDDDKKEYKKNVTCIEMYNIWLRSGMSQTEAQIRYRECLERNQTKINIVQGSSGSRSVSKFEEHQKQKQIRDNVQQNLDQQRLAFSKSQEQINRTSNQIGRAVGNYYAQADEYDRKQNESFDNAQQVLKTGNTRPLERIALKKGPNRYSANRMLAEYYFKGEHVPQDLDRTLFYYRRIVDTENRDKTNAKLYSQLLAEKQAKPGESPNVTVRRANRIKENLADRSFFGYAGDMQTPIGFSFGGLHHSKVNGYLTLKINKLFIDFFNEKPTKANFDDGETHVVEVKEDFKSQDLVGIDFTVYDIENKYEGKASATFGLTLPLTLFGVPRTWLYFGTGFGYTQRYFSADVTKLYVAGSRPILPNNYYDIGEHSRVESLVSTKEEGGYNSSDDYIRASKLSWLFDGGLMFRYKFLYVSAGAKVNILQIGGGNPTIEDPTTFSFGGGFAF